MITCSISEDLFYVIDKSNGVTISMIHWDEEENSFCASVSPQDSKGFSFKLISKDEAMQIIGKWTEIALNQVLNNGESL